MTYDDMVKQCGITVEHNVATAPSPPPTLWLADPDAWRLYAGVEVEPVQDRFIEREMIKL